MKAAVTCSIGFKLLEPNPSGVSNGHTMYSYMIRVALYGILWTIIPHSIHSVSIVRGPFWVSGTVGGTSNLAYIAT